MINIQSIQQLHCSRVSIVRWNLKEAGCEEYTNSRANLWSDEQKSHMRSCMWVRQQPMLKPNNYTESCMINEADGWRGRNVWYPGRSVRYAPKGVTTVQSSAERTEVSRGHSSRKVKDRISRSLEYDRERRNDRLWQKMVIDFHLVVSLPLCQ